MENLIRDIKLGLKLLWKDRGFAGTAILTLAVCIGANAAIFTIVNSVLLRPLPVPEPDRIMFVSNQYPGAGVPETYSVAIPDYFDHRRGMPAFEEQAMFRSEARTVDINGTAESLKAMRVTPSLLRLLRTSPAVGRPFTDAEGEPGNEQKVILSHGLWQELYGGNPAVIGQNLKIGGRPYSIVGIMPRDFLFFDAKIRLWVPYAFTDREKSDDSRHSNNSSQVGRLKPGATMQQAQAQLDAINAANLDRFPNFKQFLINAGFHTHVWSLQDVLVRDIKATLYLLWGGAALVLLIGGVNIANLVLARSSLRKKELATRLALGASRVQVGRYVMLESLIVALAGGFAGLAIGTLGLRALRTIGLDQIPRASEIHMDAAVIGFVLAISVAVGLSIGLVPLTHLSRINLSTVLREESRSGTGGRAARAIRRGLVVAQVGLACVLLVGAGLLLASFRQLLAVDPGFKASGVITISTSAPGTKYPKDTDAGVFMNRALDAIRGIPGVRAAGATTSIPFGGSINKNVILAEGYVMKPGESVLAPMAVDVTPGYFEAMGTSLKRGRYFDDHDSAASTPAAIVDERLARKFWPGVDPIGKRLYQPGDADVLKIDEHTKFWTVVGVVADVQLADLTGSEQPLGAYYFSLNQSPSHRFTFAVKTAAGQEALVKMLRTEMAKIDPDSPLSDINSMEERTRLSLVARRAAMLLGLAFGGVALFLAAVGIYGVLTYLVAQRTREIGIRIALGSSASGVFKLVLREGMFLVLSGQALGIAGAAGLRTLIAGQIYGVRPMDPLIISIVLLGLAGIALSACVLPARRATQVDPVQVLTAN